MIRANENSGRGGEQGVGARRWLAWAVALGWMVSAAAQDLQIQFAEKVSIAATAGHTEFDAYGRRFSLDLADNDRLLSSLNRSGKIEVAAGRLLRGKLRDVPGSWVRLARVGDALEGAIWDGHDLYVVTSKRRVDANLTLAIDGAPSQTVVYRLSDTLGGLPAQFCGLAVESAASPAKAESGLEQYKATVSALRADAAALTVAEQLEIALIADTSFQDFAGLNARDSMLARLNTVDGIFGEQVGILIVPTEIRLVPAGADPFTSTKPQTLLNQLADYRSSTPALRAPGLAHLVTGKLLDGDTVGIAFLDSLCDSREGVSLSDSELGEFFSALVMAHELGHNFGAPHDGATGSACSTTPQSWIMAPALNGSAQFSACSLSRMQIGIARARNVCIGPLHYADVTLSLPTTPLNFNAQEEFGIPVTVRSIGNDTAKNVTLRFELPAPFTFRSAVLPDGSCSATGNVVTCQLGDLAAGATRSVELRLIGNTLGTYYLTGGANADNDFIASNNLQTIYLGLQSALDLAVDLSASATQVFVTDPVDFHIDVSSTRARDAHAAQLVFNAGGAPIESFTAGAHACQIPAGIPYQLNCTLADVPAHTTTRITVRVRPTFAGIVYANAGITLADDGDYSNDGDAMQVSARAEREVATSVSTENLRVVIGTEHDVVYTLDSVGRLPATGVQLLVSSGLEFMQSVTPSAGVCTRPGPGFAYTCDFGQLDPGEARTVTVRVRLDAAGQSSMSGSTQYMNGAISGYSNVFTSIYANVRVDAAAAVSSAQALEGQTGTGNFDVQSIGIDPAQNVVATLIVPEPLRLLAVRLSYNPQGFQCTLVPPRTARCTGSFGVDAQSPNEMRAWYDVVSDDPVTAQATLSLSADADGNAANDSAQGTVRVTPNVSVELASTTTFLSLFAGRTTPMQLTFTTGRHAVEGAMISAYGSEPYYAVEGISFDGRECPRAAGNMAPFGTFSCEIGDLPANGSWPVSVRYHAYQAGIGGGISIMAGARNQTGGRSTYGFSFNIIGDADLQVATTVGTATATVGTLMPYPRITVTSAGAQALDVDVDIPLPGFTTLASVASGGSCGGTTVVHCHFDSVGVSRRETIDIVLNTPAAGSFTSNVTARAMNDSSAGNNSATVSLNVTAAPSVGSSSGGAGSSSGGSSGGSSTGASGGGGRLEWLVLAFLGLLAMRRGVGAGWDLRESARRATR